MSTTRHADCAAATEDLVTASIAALWLGIELTEDALARQTHALAREELHAARSALGQLMAAVDRLRADARHTDPAQRMA